MQIFLLVRFKICFRVIDANILYGFLATFICRYAGKAILESFYKCKNGFAGKERARKYYHVSKDLAEILYIL